MMTIAIQRSDAMSTESDTGWVSLATLGASVLSFVLGGLGAAFLRGMSWARVSGETDGEAHAWRQSIEEQLRALATATVASELRINSRMAAIEARKDRIDDKLERVPTRDEMNEGFKRIELQLARLDDYTRHPGRAS